MRVMSRHKPFLAVIMDNLLFSLTPEEAFPDVCFQVEKCPWKEKYTGDKYILCFISNCYCKMVGVLPDYSVEKIFSLPLLG